MTRAEIETLVADTLNRNDLNGNIASWFTIAHKEIQRLYNKFTGTEATAYITLVENTQSYDVVANFKEPILAYLWDDVNSKVVKFYNKSNIQSVRNRRFESDPEQETSQVLHTYDVFMYAIHNNKFELTPTITAAIAAYKFGIDYYQWLSPPATDSEDWFTIHAADFLLYRTLREAVPFVGLSDGLETKWKDREKEALRNIIGIDVSGKNSGPLRLKG